MLTSQPAASVFGFLQWFTPRTTGGDSLASYKVVGQVLPLRAKSAFGPRKMPAAASSAHKHCCWPSNGGGHTE